MLRPILEIFREIYLKFKLWYRLNIGITTYLKYY